MKRSNLTELAIELPAKAKVIEKETYGLKDRMFSGNTFKVGKKTFVSSQDEIYIGGTDYDACVLAIGYQFFDHGFQPHFILDCVGSHSNNPVSKVNFIKLCTKDFGKDCIVRKGKFNGK